MKDPSPAAPTAPDPDSAMNDTLPQVGSPDPERETSPIIDESAYDEQIASRDLEREAPACHFNGETFPVGAYVLSGSEVLQCSDRGVWTRKGEERPM